MRILGLVILIAMTLISWGVVWAADPEVTQVNLAQRTDGSGLVDITYDLFDADGDTVAVTLQLSADGGINWDFPVLNASGDVGQGIVPGMERNIVWDAGSVAQDIDNEVFQARVIASDVGGVSELINDGHDGWLIPPGQPDRLATAMSQAFTDPQLSDRLGCAAAQRVVQHHHPDSFYRSLINIYHRAQERHQ